MFALLYLFNLHCLNVLFCTQSKTFNVTSPNNAGGPGAGLTLDWDLGFALYDPQTRSYQWQYKFSQLRGSSDDGKSRLKLHFHDTETKCIETKVCIVSSL